MTEREVLKLALEALEINLVFLRNVKPFKGQEDLATDCIAMTEETITAIKEALAQPEQEPVTWGVDWGRAGQTPCVSIIKRLNDGRIEVVAVEYGPQRTWVGLTDEERDGIFELHHTRLGGWDYSGDAVMYEGHFEDAVVAIEAKLKQKNGYAEEKNT